MNKLEIENGKYQIENNNGIVKVYRHGELWLDGVTKFELCLIQRIEELEQQNKRYREIIKKVRDELNRQSGAVNDLGQVNINKDLLQVFLILNKALEGEE